MSAATPEKLPLVVVYSDLNCPFCFLLHDRLARAGLEERVDWRGVEHEPDIPFGHYTPHAASTAALETEVIAVRQRSAEDGDGELPIVVPARRPNSGLALSTVAAGKLDDPLAAHRLCVALFEALWLRGEDISDPRVIDAAGAELGLGPLCEQARFEQVRSWTREFREASHDRFPTAVSPTGSVMAGAADRRRVELFFRSGLFSTKNADACAA